MPWLRWRRLHWFVSSNLLATSISVAYKSPLDCPELNEYIYIYISIYIQYIFIHACIYTYMYVYIYIIHLIHVKFSWFAVGNDLETVDSQPDSPDLCESRGGYYSMDRRPRCHCSDLVDLVWSIGHVPGETCCLR